MKSTLITLCALLGVAYVGSFFELWSLPHQKGDPFTYRDAFRKAKKITGYEEDLLLKERERQRTENENMIKSSE